MPVTVTATVTRGAPLPALVAWLLTLVGLGLMVFGWPVVLPMDAGGGFAEIVLIAIALLLAVPAWAIFLLVIVRSARARRRIVSEVPAELAEPPSGHDPAVVAVLHGEGKPDRTAIAGTVLDLAHRGVVDVEQFGDRIVIRVPPDAEGASECERLVLAGLREHAEPAGDVVGPPVFRRKATWWRSFRKDACGRAADAGLVEPVIPYVGLMVVLIFTVVALSLVMFERILVFVGLVLFANGFPHLLGLASGYRLTAAGRSLRARWEAFGRYLGAQGSVRDVGPAAVAIWGPNLAYGAVLDQAPGAARPLTPGVPDEGREHDAGHVVSTTWKLRD